MNLAAMAPTARRMMEQVLAVRPGERLVIVTDFERPRSITELLTATATLYGLQTVVVAMPAREMGGEEPPPAVAAAMREADCIIVQTSHSMTHTNAEREALRAGARVCNIREVDEEMMVRGGMTADYEEVDRITRRGVTLLGAATRARLTTPEGTDLTLDLTGRPAFALSGFAREPGQFSGLPDGEAAIAPVEGRTEGVLVNPYLIEKIGQVTEPFRLEVRAGEIVRVEGGAQAQALAAILARKDPGARNFAAELALGTNPACRLIPKSREIKKRLGQAHVALGDNLSLAGVVESAVHLDIILLRPTLMLDDRLVLDNGDPLFAREAP
ncbi:MAG: aminopeptidase [Armatimonadota bacterium]|nr:aminopeptidase [Armatimonadota bacterium]MDR7452142.1 aminopeptidase [Armatimonadota bacterium]MDR7467866.1 aminopeptidase [Armatimonadota bacterium]MDR7494754.1 aminopeptidase [Armatimonadota bacterium]MDR7499579.1 aminopeptidase [Armatimonadota bacterium]